MVYLKMATPLPRMIGFPNGLPDPITVERSKLSTLLMQDEMFQRAERQEPIVKIGRSFHLGPLQTEKVALINPIGPRGPILRGIPLIPHDLPAG